MNGWSVYWLTWLTVTFASFLAPEVYALATKHPENTLSWQIWRLEKIMPGESIWHWSALHILLGGSLFIGLVWLAVHLVFGIWR